MEKTWKIHGMIKKQGMTADSTILICLLHGVPSRDSQNTRNPMSFCVYRETDSAVTRVDVIRQENQ